MRSYHLSICRLSAGVEYSQVSAAITLRALPCMLPTNPPSSLPPSAASFPLSARSLLDEDGEKEASRAAGSASKAGGTAFTAELQARLAAQTKQVVRLEGVARTQELRIGQVGAPFVACTAEAACQPFPSTARLT